MAEPPEERVLAVEAVLVGQDRLHRGSLCLTGGRVERLCAAPRGARPRTFAIPGLRNAHVHLDLSLVSGVPRPTRGFTQWVLDLLRERGRFDPAALARGAAAGARECLAAGTTTVGDVDSSGAAAAAVAASGLKGVAFRELLGTRGEELVPAVRRWVAEFEEFAPGGRLRPGVSPHAPYSTPSSLYAAARSIAADHGLALATHAAETREEHEFVTSGRGAFSELLATLGVHPPFDEPPGCSPLRFLADLGCLGPDVLLAHANYPVSGDVELLAESGATVVYCPRSHRFFSHEPHPVRRYLEAGVRVALGTDSRTSNDSLSMLEELAFLRVARPEVSPATAFWMATGAAAHLLDGGSGRLEPGESADLVVLESARELPRDLDGVLDLVTSGAVRVAATLVSGEVCYTREFEVGEAHPLTPEGSGLFSSVSEGTSGDSST